MNTTSFTDKQIMDLTSQPSKVLIDFMNNNQSYPKLNDERHREEDEEEQRVEGGEGTQHLNEISKDDIVPSYDFHLTRPMAISPNYDSAPNFSFSSPPHANPTNNSYSSLDAIEPAKVVVEKDRKGFDATVLPEVEQIMKKYTEPLLHTLKQLENRTLQIENSVDNLKSSIGNNHSSTDGNLRQLGNTLHELKTAVQTIQNKQDIVEHQLRLAMLQVSKTDQQSQSQTSVITDPVQQAASAPQQSQQQLPSPVNLPQSISAVPPPNAPTQPPPQQGLPSLVQLPNQVSQNQIPAASQRDPYFPPPPPPVQSQEVPNQQYQLPLTQQPHPQPGAPPHQLYQQTPHPQYSQPASHLPQQQPSLSPVNLPQLQSSLGHHIEETPYTPSQNYSANLRQPTSQPSSGPPPSQQYYSAPPHASYEPPSSRPGSGYSSGYSTISGPAEPYRYGGSSQYGGTPAIKPPQLPTASSVAPSGGSGYPQLPTARVLPQALPTASAAGGGGSGSGGTGSRVPIDDVVDKVASMGFTRDHVRATVRQLTENGQAVDLNTVLDKLMNAGEGQPTRGWFGR